MRTQDDNATVEELQALAPERSIPIGDETVTFRPFGFLEATRLSELARPLLTDMHDVFSREDGEAVSLEDVEGLFARHPKIFTQLMAESSGREPAFFEGLGDQEGYMALLTFWEVCNGFFVQRLMARTVQRRRSRMAIDAAVTEAASGSGPESSSPH